MFPCESFNPRARMGRDAPKYIAVLEFQKFQSTRPHGARPLAVRTLARASSFNPRARMGRDVVSPSASSICSRFQSTRPHGARPGGLFGPGGMVGVSIHAPARGATLGWAGGRSSPLLFQSTRPHGARRWTSPPRPSPSPFQSTRPHGARRVQGMSFGEVVAFQSTRPHGARQVDIAAKTITVAVSIHAPARGATGHDYACCVGDVFQSTRPHGARQPSAPRRLSAA